MAWIRLEQSLLTHHKTIAVARALKIRPVAVMGHMSALWLWCVDNAEDGCLTMPPEDIATAADWRRNPQLFIDALVAARFLDRCENGYDVHNWNIRAGRLIEMRAKNAERMRGARAQPHDVHVQSTFTARAGATDGRTDGDKERRVEDERTNVPRTAPVPPATRTDALGDAALPPAAATLTEPEILELVEEFGQRLGGDAGVRSCITEALSLRSIDRFKDPLPKVRKYLKDECAHTANGKKPSKRGPPGTDVAPDAKAIAAAFSRTSEGFYAGPR